MDLPRAYGYFLSHKPYGFMGLLRSHGVMLGVGAMLLLVTNLIMTMLPALVNGAVSLIERDQPLVLFGMPKPLYLTSITGIVSIIIVAALIGAVLRTLSRIVLFDVGRIIERDLRAKLYFHICVLDERFFSKLSVGDLMNHLTTDITNIRLVTGFAVLNIVNIFFVFGFTVPLLLRIDPILACLALLPFPLIALAMQYITKKMFHATLSYQEQLSMMISHIQENLLGAHVVRLFHQQEREGERFLKTNQNTYDAGVRLGRIRVLMMPMMRLLVGFSVGLVLYFGGRAVFLGRISLGDFVEINGRILQLAWPAMSVGFILSMVSRGRASLERVNTLLRSMPTIQDGEKAISPVHKVDVHSLVMTSSAHGKDAVNFSVHKGQMLGIVGPSGSFKSTLLKVLCRRHYVPDGHVFYNGHDINHLTLDSLYEQISVVPQESYLFNTSIKNNIRFARPDASDQEIDEVVALLRLDRDVRVFKDGLDTIVGERGVMLSGGQKQRVALARALVAKRGVLLLDDALSAVDKDTENHIVLNLRAYVRDAIVIVVSHRLSLLRQADSILVLDKGRIIESGRHDELLEKEGLYRSLWDIDRLMGHGS